MAHLSKGTFVPRVWFVAARLPAQVVAQHATLAWFDLSLTQSQLESLADLLVVLGIQATIIRNGNALLPFTFAFRVTVPIPLPILVLALGIWVMGT